jgi:basic membrane protein A
MGNELAMRIGSFHPDIPADVVDEVNKLIENMKSGAVVVIPQ